MNLFTKIILIIFGIAYFISPLDIIPDFIIPYLGWLDDTFIVGIILYLLRYNKLPSFQNFSRLYYTFKNNSGSFSQKENQSAEINNDPYEILGINRDATKDEIQKAYKHKAKQYHPDKVSHLGEELQKVANEKFLEIQKAYDLLMKNP